MKDLVHQKYAFSWEVLDVIIGGKSLIDSNLGLTGFPMRTKQDADRFVRSYGYNLEDPIEAAETLGNFQEAVNFIRKSFLYPDNPEGVKLEIPRKIIEITDTRDLLLMASMSFPGQTSDTQGILLKNWACSILKVIHTIAHIDKDVRNIYVSDIQKQILDRFYKHVHRDSDGQLYLGEKPEDPLRVNLVSFETKPKKSRESILLKLLHKPENVAENIFDQVGVRFVTSDAVEGLQVVKYLKDSMIVVPANVKPSRSRNTLVDIESFKSRLESLLMEVEKGDLSGGGLKQKLSEISSAAPMQQQNPHSSEFYRAIQFTSRQLIKLKNPLFDSIKELQGLVKQSQVSAEVLKATENINLKYVQREVRFFYPYEVQIMDKASAHENEGGRSAHSGYKKSQFKSAMNRVMGNLLDAVRD